jgi:hypothetical protein
MTPAPDRLAPRLLMARVVRRAADRERTVVLPMHRCEELKARVTR